MGCIAIYAKIKPPIFSIKSPEAFQVGSSLPLPQPSSLVGALAYVLAITENLSSEEALKKARDVVLATGAYAEKLIIPSTVILRRFRILDRGFEKPKKREVKLTEVEKLALLLESKDYYSAKMHLEKTLTDALYREYMFSETITCLWVLREKVEAERLRLIVRLGDTESYVNVVNSWEDKCDIVEKNIVETKYPIPMVKEEIESVQGRYIIAKMCDKFRRLKWFIIPLTREIRETRRGIKYLVYKPTVVHVKFKKKVPVATTFLDEIPIL